MKRSNILHLSLFLAHLTYSYQSAGFNMNTDIGNSFTKNLQPKKSKQQTNETNKKQKYSGVKKADENLLCIKLRIGKSFLPNNNIN
jgi:hypothetical protein